MGITDRILPSGNTQIESSSSQVGYGLTLNGQVLVYKTKRKRWILQKQRCNMPLRIWKFYAADKPQEGNSQQRHKASCTYMSLFRDGSSPAWVNIRINAVPYDSDGDGCFRCLLGFVAPGITLRQRSSTNSHLAESTSNAVNLFQPPQFHFPLGKLQNVHRGSESDVLMATCLFWKCIIYTMIYMGTQKQQGAGAYMCVCSNNLV